jgi:transcriptional regulator with XRE-family HTH domain
MPNEKSPTAHAGGEAVGAYLRSLREAAGLTIAQISNTIAIDPSQIWRIEGGKADCRGSILFKFLTAVGGDPNDIALLINNPTATRSDGETIARLRKSLTL